MSDFHRAGNRCDSHCNGFFVLFPFLSSPLAADILIQSAHSSFTLPVIKKTGRK
jgi:hypothetical protein